MTELQSLYHELILDHGQSPKNYREIQDPTLRSEGFNPLCGDKVELYLTIENDRIQDAAFKGQGCAISTASASLMTEALIGKTLSEAETLFKNFQTLLTTDKFDDCFAFDLGKDLGKLQAFSGVRAYPMRVKCATLAWHAFHDALKKSFLKEKEAFQEKVIETLRDIYDPELPVNIYDLGLIYSIEINRAMDVVNNVTNNTVENNFEIAIEMTLTSPGCPVAETFPQMVQDRLLSLQNVSKVSVALVWEPPWTKDRMSDATKLELNML